MRAINCEARIGSDANCNVGPLVHEVDDLVGKHDVQSDFRVRCGEPWDQRQQAVQTERDVAIDPHQSARDGSGSNRPFGLVQVGQDAVRSFEKGLALGGEQQLAGRAIDQPRAQPPLQPRHKLADRRRRHAQSARGRRKAAQLDGPDEHLHLSRAIDLLPRHDEFISQMLVFAAV